MNTTTTTNEKPMTKRTFLEAVISGQLTEEVQNWASAELNKMDIANDKRKGQQSKKSKANEPIKAAILALLTASGSKVASDIADGLTAEGITTAEGEKISTSKASALCRQMVEDGQLTVAEVKIPKKGKVKQYTAVIVEVEAEDEAEDETEAE